MTKADGFIWSVDFVFIDPLFSSLKSSSVPVGPDQFGSFNKVLFRINIHAP